MSGAKVNLSKAIKAHGEEVEVLELREPTVEDTMEVGTPFLIIAGDDEQKIEIRNKVVAKYISLLAKVPMSSVKQLTIPDFQLAQAAVLSFFGKEASEAPSS
jgi:hypothetical protein